MTASRRRVLGLAAGVAAGLAGCAAAAPRRHARAPRPRVVVVGGGYGGATAARYLALLSNAPIDIVLIEPEPAFVSCPMSNLVLAGTHALADITRSYRGLAERRGIELVRDHATHLDAAARSVRLHAGGVLRYDKLVLAPGIGMMWDAVAGLRAAAGTGRILQAWGAPGQTAALRRQLEAMPDGGVYAIVIPEMPYRCPPAPYERACLVASYFKRAKPRAKVLVLDANEQITSEAALFGTAFAADYSGIIEYRPQHKAVAVDAARLSVSFEFQDDVRADVLNVLPPMRAGALAVSSGLADANGRWCSVDFLNFESTRAEHVHVIGDAIQIAPLMPKSGHMANGHGKVAAAAIVAALEGFAPDPQPMLSNTCYSFVDTWRAAHIASVHAYRAAERTFLSVAGSGGVSAAPSELEGRYAWDWAHTIWADTLS